MKIEIKKASEFAAGLKVYVISADGGKTWTSQWLTKEDVQWHLNHGYIVKEV